MVQKKSKKKGLSIQPLINIGLVGHVDHGKTTLTHKLTGKWTDTHSEELKKGITIRLGYANACFYKCNKCKGFEAYTYKKKCDVCGSETEPLRKVSFVDAPGHESLMATMLAGATIMDAAILLVAANEECPQPQTAEHLIALQISGIKNIIIVQNKIDLVKKEEALNNYNQIREFLKDTEYKDAPIIPISAQHNINIDVLIKAINDFFPTPVRDKNKDPFMLIARSFDMNKPGTKIKDLKGGVLGGSLLQGNLKIGDEIEILPGYRFQEKGNLSLKPLKTKIVGLQSGSDPLEEVGPGGSIGVMTTLDPSVVKADSLSGCVVGHPGKLPNVVDTITFEPHLLERVVGTRDELKVEPLKLNEMLMINVNSATTLGIIKEIKKNKVVCSLKLPVCVEKGSRITLSRRLANRFRLSGYGIIL